MKSLSKAAANNTIRLTVFLSFFCLNCERMDLVNTVSSPLTSAERESIVCSFLKMELSNNVLDINDCSEILIENKSSQYLFETNIIGFQYQLGREETYFVKISEGIILYPNDSKIVALKMPDEVRPFKVFPLIQEVRIIGYP